MARYYIDTNDISLKETNDINRYIAETLNYSHSDITSDIEKSLNKLATKQTTVNLLESLSMTLALTIQPLTVR